jgi:ribosomal protein L5
MARLQQFYREKVVPDLVTKFGYVSTMQVPRITKITLNMGVSEAVSDKKVMEHAVSDLTKIAGQKPVVTKSKMPSPASRSVTACPSAAWSRCAASRCMNSSTAS